MSLRMVKRLAKKQALAAVGQVRARQDAYGQQLDGVMRVIEPALACHVGLHSFS